MKWVHTYYIKGDRLMDMKSKTSYSWLMKAILKQRESLVCMQTTWNQMMHNKMFRMKKVYMKMRSVNHDPVPWNRIFYGNTTRPRAMMTLWLACHGTKERLHQFGLMDSIICCFCPQEETTNHMFYGCVELKAIWNKVLEWIQVAHDPKEWQDELK